MSTTRFTMSYGTSEATALEPGNPYAPLISENERREQTLGPKLSGLMNELRLGKAMLIAGLVFVMLVCAMTFGVVATALEYSKETYVAAGALTDSATDQVVSTRDHEEHIEHPLHPENAGGVQWITISHHDGGLSRRRVEGYTTVKCIKKDEHCNTDGYNYFFFTTTGPYAGTYKAHGLNFSPVSKEYVSKAVGAKGAQPGMLSGY